MSSPLKSPDLSPRIRILLAIEQGHTRMKDIAAATGLSMSTLSKWLNILIAGGLARRQGHSYHLTSAGRRTLEEALAAICGKRGGPA